MAMPADAAPGGRRRPVPVTILAAIQLVTALLLGVSAVGLVLDPTIASATLGDAVGTGEVTGLEVATLAVILGVMAALELVAAVALLRLSRLGWTLTMLLAGVSLATQILTFWSTGEVLTLSMLLSVATVLYLNQRPVRVAFGLADVRGADLEEERG
jgi:hypothetical protein